jgi:hypothetical protein
MAVTKSMNISSIELFSHNTDERDTIPSGIFREMRPTKSNKICYSSLTNKRKLTAIIIFNWSQKEIRFIFVTIYSGPNWNSKREDLDEDLAALTNVIQTLQ